MTDIYLFHFYCNDCALNYSFTLCLSHFAVIRVVYTNIGVDLSKNMRSRSVRSSHRTVSGAWKN